MNITVCNKYRIEVELSFDELSDLGITYEDLDYRNIETRRVLWSLLEHIKQISGAEIAMSGRLLIEVFREKEECCRICFTAVPKRGEREISLKQLVKKENVPMTAEFEGFDRLCRAVRAAEPGGCCSLFELNGKYRLIIGAKTCDKEILSALLGEFGEISDNSQLKIAECEEYWHCLSRGGAAEMLKNLL